MPLFDAHVHLFPDRLFDAIWTWFDQNAWPITHRCYSEQVFAELQIQGVDAAVGLCYAHRPGIAEGLNAFMAELACRHAKLVAMGTLLPGEPGEADILRRIFEVHRLRGIKIHCHVQQMAPDDESFWPTCEAVCQHQGVLIIHAGRAPVLPSQKERIMRLCGLQRTRNMLKRFPHMKVVVPHLGMDEYEGYRELLSEFPNLYLDTAMAVGDFFGQVPPVSRLEDISDRVLFGTDFPNLPYAYSNEIDALSSGGLSAQALDRILWQNAARLFGLMP